MGLTLENIRKAKKILKANDAKWRDRLFAATNENGETVLLDNAMLSLAMA